MVAYAYNPSTWEVETAGLQFPEQLQQLRKILSNLARPCFKPQNKKGWGCSSELECPWIQSPVPHTHTKKMQFNALTTFYTRQDGVSHHHCLSTAKTSSPQIEIMLQLSNNSLPPPPSS